MNAEQIAAFKKRFKEKPMFCCPTGSLCCTGFTLIILAVILPPLILEAIDQELYDATHVDSYVHPAYEEWLTSRDRNDVPEYLVLYVWNVTNLDAFINGNRTVKADLDEVGPYIYRYFTDKLDVTFGDYASMGFDEGEITYYRRHKTFYWDTEYHEDFPNARNPYTDVVSTVDLVYIGAYILGAPESVLRQGRGGYGTRLFHGEDSNRLISVHEYFFGPPECYDNIENEVPATCFPIYSNVTVEQWNNPYYVYYEGFRGLRNGRDNISLSNQFIEFDGVREYPDTWINFSQVVYGSDGTVYHRGVRHRDKLRAWDSFTVRIYDQYNYNKFSYNLQDIEVYRFYTDRTAYDNCETNANNCKYYHNGPQGLINISNVAEGIPMWLSEAHLYGVDPEVRRGVTVNGGEMSPTNCRLLHCSVADVMPYTGYTIGGGFVSEISVFVENTPGDFYPNLRPTYLPCYWAFEGANITGKLANDLKVIPETVDLAGSLFFTGVILGPILLALGAFYLRRWHDAWFVTLGEFEEKESVRGGFTQPLLINK